MRIEIADTVRVADGRAIFYADQGIAPDGGMSERWVPFTLGPIRAAFPNTAGRKAAVMRHDLHHVATGYITDHAGEAEIAAFELGGGCGRFGAAWVLDVAALGMGLWGASERLLPAYVRGRRSGTLYHQAWDEALLDGSVGELRARLGLDRDTRPPTASERLGFAGWVVASALLWVGWIPVTAVIVSRIA